MAKFKALGGGTRSKILTKYLIDWDKKSLSKFQFDVKQFLRKFWENHVCYEEMPVVGTRMTIDLVNMTRRIAVEVQGAQHGKFNKFFHGEHGDKFLDQIDRDEKKRLWCEINDIKLIEIFTEDMPLSRGFFEERYDTIL